MRDARSFVTVPPTGTRLTWTSSGGQEDADLLPTDRVVPCSGSAGPAKTTFPSAGDTDNPGGGRDRAVRVAKEEREKAGSGGRGPGEERTVPGQKQGTPRSNRARNEGDASAVDPHGESVEVAAARAPIECQISRGAPGGRMSDASRRQTVRASTDRGCDVREGSPPFDPSAAACVS